MPVTRDNRATSRAEMGSVTRVADDRPWLLGGARVVSDPERPAVDRGALAIAGPTIVATGPLSRLGERFPDAPVVDHPDATVLPGMVNAHVHLAFDVTADPIPTLTAGYRDALRATIAANAAALLDEGVTTARDLGDRDGLVAEYRDAVAGGLAVGPRMLVAHEPLTPPGGHCWFLGGEVDGPEAIRAAVADRAERGADWIKVMAGGGMMTPSSRPIWSDQFSGDELAVVVDAARDAGLPVAAHAHGTDTMALCARVGVDTIEHGSWRTGPTVSPRHFDARPDVAAAIAAAVSALVPTRARGWRTWEASDRDGLLARLAWNDDHGIDMVVGTDAGVGQGFFDDIVETLMLYRAAGFSPARVLAMATTRAADTLGRPDLGRLVPGAPADVLVVGGDPTVDLESLRDVRLVVAAGRVR